MPAYDFRCDACDQRFSLYLRISERDNGICPHCGSRQLKRLLTTFYVAGSSSGAGCTRTSCSGCSTKSTCGV